VLAVVVFGFLHRTAPRVMPSLGLVPRIVAAAVPAFLVLLAPAPWEVDLVLSLGVFAALAVVLRAIPFELVHALRNR
jgi:hypothetical protein